MSDGKDGCPLTEEGKSLRKEKRSGERGSTPRESVNCKFTGVNTMCDRGEFLDISSLLWKGGKQAVVTK